MPLTCDDLAGRLPVPNEKGCARTVDRVGQPPTLERRARAPVEEIYVDLTVEGRGTGQPFRDMKMASAHHKKHTTPREGSATGLGLCVYVNTDDASQKSANTASGETQRFLGSHARAVEAQESGRWWLGRRLDEQI